MEKIQSSNFYEQKPLKQNQLEKVSRFDQTVSQKAHIKSENLKPELLNEVARLLRSKQAATNEQLLLCRRSMLNSSWKQYTNTVRECVDGIDLIKSLKAAQETSNQSSCEKAILESTNKTLVELFKQAFKNCQPDLTHADSSKNTKNNFAPKYKIYWPNNSEEFKDEIYNTEEFRDSIKEANVNRAIACLEGELHKIKAKYGEGKLSPDNKRKCNIECHPFEMPRRLLVNLRDSWNTPQKTEILSEYIKIISKEGTSGKVARIALNTIRDDMRTELHNTLDEILDCTEQQTQEIIEVHNKFIDCINTYDQNFKLYSTYFEEEKLDQNPRLLIKQVQERTAVIDRVHELLDKMDEYIQEYFNRTENLKETIIQEGALLDESSEIQNEDTKLYNSYHDIHHDEYNILQIDYNKAMSKYNHSMMKQEEWKRVLFDDKRNERIGLTIGNQYRLLPEIIRGGFGTIYKATDEKNDNTLVAIKTIELDKIADYDERIQARKMFFEEADLHERLEHPNIPKIHSYLHHNGQPYLVMDYAGDQTLRDYLKEVGNKATLYKAMQIAIPSLDILEYLRTYDSATDKPPLVHNDINLNNVTHNSLTGDIFLIDFGIAQIIKPGPQKNKDLQGTSGYIAPERLKGETTTFHSDTYSLGVVLYQLLSGKQPDRMNPHHFPDLSLDSHANKEAKEALGIIMQMVKTDPKERPQDLVKTKEKLQKLLLHIPQQMKTQDTTPSIVTTDITENSTNLRNLPHRDFIDDNYTNNDTNITVLVTADIIASPPDNS